MGVTRQYIMSVVLRTSEVTHCGGEYMMGLPWRLFLLAVDEAVKMSKERAGNG